MTRLENFRSECVGFLTARASFFKQSSHDWSVHERFRNSVSKDCIECFRKFDFSHLFKLNEFSQREIQRYSYINRVSIVVQPGKIFLLQSLKIIAIARYRVVPQRTSQLRWYLVPSKRVVNTSFGFVEENHRRLGLFTERYFHRASFWRQHRRKCSHYKHSLVRA